MNRPQLLFPIDFDEETDSNSQPLLGRYDTSRTLVIVVPPIEIPFVDMAKFDVRDYASTVQDKELPNLRTWYGIPDSITLQLLRGRSAPILGPRTRCAFMSSHLMVA